MTQPRIIGHRELRGEMMAAARGERPVPAHAGTQTFESVEALMRLLTPENRRLLALIRDRSPRSIAELAAMSGRAAPNLTRTLAELEAAGLIRMQQVERRKVPTTTVRMLRIDIDPFAQNDQVELV